MDPCARTIHEQHICVCVYTRYSRRWLLSRLANPTLLNCRLTFWLCGVGFHCHGSMEGVDRKKKMEQEMEWKRRTISTNTLLLSSCFAINTWKGKIRCSSFSNKFFTRPGRFSVFCILGKKVAPRDLKFQFKICIYILYPIQVSLL